MQIVISELIAFLNSLLNSFNFNVFKGRLIKKGKTILIRQKNNLIHHFNV